MQKITYLRGRTRRKCANLTLRNPWLVYAKEPASLRQNKRVSSIKTEDYSVCDELKKFLAHVILLHRFGQIEKRWRCTEIHRKKMVAPEMS